MAHAIGLVLPYIGVGEGLLVCLIAPLVIGILIAIGIAAYRAEQKRREEFMTAARENGLSYSPDERGDWDDRWPRFECFHRGHSRCAFNLMSGRLGGNGPECVTGEYRFKETHGSGKNRRTVTYTFGFAILNSAVSGTPDVLIRREHIFDKVAGFFGFDDIDFESAEFSRTFMVKSPDKRFAYDLIDAQMMEFLLLDGTPNIDIGADAVCLWYGQSNRLEPRALVELARWGEAFLGRWPRVVRAQFGSQQEDAAGRSTAEAPAPPPPPPQPPLEDPTR
jgi:hypothetical protein